MSDLRAIIERMLEYLARMKRSVAALVRSSSGQSYASGVPPSPPTQQATLVALLRTRPNGMRWPELTARVVEAGSAVEVWEWLTQDALIPSPGEPDHIELAAADIRSWVGRGIAFLTVLDKQYPARLRGIHEAPPVLFARGQLIADDPAVSVVGSRKASEHGLALAAEVARGLVHRGVTVLSGLALGIDAAAHRAALLAGGRTVAVLGTGIERSYPPTHRALQDEIAARGLLISQFWPDAPPQKHTFPMRNATMSGYGIATVVVEAGETSGARGQARMAVEHGRPVILTDLVVAVNEWAQALRNRPGVYVGESAEDVLAIVETLVARRQSVDELLRQIVPA